MKVSQILDCCIVFFVAFVRRASVSGIYFLFLATAHVEMVVERMSLERKVRSCGSGKSKTNGRFQS